VEYVLHRWRHDTLVVEPALEIGGGLVEEVLGVGKLGFADLRDPELGRRSIANVGIEWAESKNGAHKFLTSALWKLP